MSCPDAVSIDEIHAALYRALRDAARKLESQRAVRRELMREIFATLEGQARTDAVEQVLAGMIGDIFAELERAMPLARTH